MLSPLFIIIPILYTKTAIPFVKGTSQGIARKLPALILGLVRKEVDFFDENKTLCIYLPEKKFVRNYLCEKNNYISLIFTSLLRKVSNSKQEILKFAFSSNYLKLIMSDGLSYFSHLIPFLYGDNVGGYRSVILFLQHIFFVS